jgi:nitrous oxidase accessory protein
MYTQHVVMEENVFIHNWGTAAYGLLLKEIKYSTVRNNRFERNTIGLYTEASTDVAITGNEFLHNGWAAKVQANSVDNRFADNNFIANTFDIATNSRQNYNQFNGNYWSQYEGYDLNRDGVGDVPYRPVSLFSYLVQRHSTAMILLRSMLVDILNAAERVMPVLTPETLVDEQPQMQPF